MSFCCVGFVLNSKIIPQVYRLVLCSSFSYSLTRKYFDVRGYVIWLNLFTLVQFIGRKRVYLRKNSDSYKYWFIIIIFYFKIVIRKCTIGINQNVLQTYMNCKDIIILFAHIFTRLGMNAN